MNGTRSRPAPYDPRLEAHVVGSIITRYATSSQLRPEHCYDHRHATILTAWRTLPQPTAQHYVLVRDGDLLLPALHIGGLERALIALQPAHARALALYAGRLAADAPVTSRADVARLRLLAAHRRELTKIETRRLELIEVHR